MPSPFYRNCKFSPLDPRFLLYIDGAGALATGSSLYGLLANYPQLFGMPAETCVWLAQFGFLYAGLGLLVGIWLIKGDYLQTQPAIFARWLRSLAILNGFYTLFSGYYLYLHATQIQPIGWAYFIMELLIVLILAFFEWKTADILSK